MAVISFDVKNISLFADGKSFSDRGQFNIIDGVVEFAVDPNNEVNKSIVDLKLAPTDQSGLVHFKSKVSLITPSDSNKGNARLMVDIVNRGRPLIHGNFNRMDLFDSIEGDGFLFNHGYSVISLGWQWDVIEDDVLYGFEAPFAKIDDTGFRGETVVEIRTNYIQKTHLLANRIHTPNTPLDINDPNARLTVRDWEDGPESIVPRSEWSFANETDSGVEPSNEYVYMESGFQPGKIYYLSYTPSIAPVVGTGMLAVRDIASFFKSDSNVNPINKPFKKVYGFGISQTGRMQRHMLYLGLNLSEDGKPAYDGHIVHVAGARKGEFNHRYAQPSQQSAPGFGHMFPFADEEMKDPYSENVDGLFNELRKINAVPKVFYTNSSAEYWRGDGANMHIHPIEEYDLPEAPEARMYHFSGTQHGAGTLAPDDVGPDGSVGMYKFNVVDYRPLLRASLINLDKWATDGTLPPPSSCPRINDETAIKPEVLIEKVNNILDINTPDPEKVWLIRRVDMGERASEGIGRLPAEEFETYQNFVSNVDEDANETGGIRMPDLTVPLGSHFGWNLRHPDTKEPDQQIAMQGISMFFAVTKEDRDKKGDRRLSINERYKTKEEFLNKVKQETGKLLDQNYILAEDVEIVISACEERYDAIVSGELKN